MTTIKITSYNADAELHKWFPFKVDASELKTTIYWDFTHGFGRAVTNPDLQFLGELATVWEECGFGVANLDARWDYWYSFRFKTEADAVFFKLRYC